MDVIREKHYTKRKKGNNNFFHFAYVLKDFK